MISEDKKNKLNYMNLYYKSSLPFKKSSKLNYVSSHVLRSLYLIKLNPIHNLTEKKILSRGSKVTRAYLDIEVDVYRGNSFKIKKFSRWHQGFKFGEFTWNRKVAMFKAKQKKKKK